MFCKKCGKQLRDDAKFCLNCGEKIIASSPIVKESFKPESEKKQITKQSTPSNSTQKTVSAKPNDSSANNTQDSMRNNSQKNNGAKIGLAIGALAVLVIAVIFIFMGKGNQTVTTNKTETAGNSSASDADSGSNAETTATEQKPNAELFTAYLENTLIPELGMADLNGRIGLFSPSDPEAQTKTIEWANTKGILGHKIADIDGDNVDELLLIHATDTNNVISVYEISNNDISLKSEFKISNTERTEVFSQNFSFIPTSNGTFIMYASNIGSAFGDGYLAEIFLLRYTGSDLIPAMKILQTAPGSVDFQYISYKYDLNGNQISEEIIYDESHYNEDEINNIYDEDGSILASQFAEYGIEINRNIHMVSPIGALEKLISDSTHHEVLCNLSVWVDQDWENDIYSFYFNDSDRDRNQMHAGYKDILENYLKDLENGTYGELVWYGNGDSSFINSDINYLYYDMNRDNYEELVVLITSIPMETKHIYSYVDNEIKCVYSSEDGYTFIDGLTKNGFMTTLNTLSIDNHETYTYYQLNNDTIETEKEFEIHEVFDENEQIIESTYRITDSTGTNYYDKTTFENIYNEYQKNILYDYEAVRNMYIPLTNIIQLPPALPSGTNTETEKATESLLPQEEPILEDDLSFENEENFQSVLNLSQEEVENEILRIREIWTADREAISNGMFDFYEPEDGIKVYYDDSDSECMIEVKSGVCNEYNMTFQIEDANLTFAYYVNDNEQIRLYFKNGRLMRWNQTDVGQASVFHDLEYSNEDFLELEKKAINDFENIMFKIQSGM